MIVVDTNIIAYFWLKLDAIGSVLVRRSRRKDSDWVAPVFWRSEFRSVLSGYIRADLLSFADALWYAQKALLDMRDSEYHVQTSDVLKLVSETGLSSYDCEYVALAQALDIPLLTGDKAVVAAVPDTAILLESYIG